jgi:hypothetical protein
MATTVTAAHMAAPITHLVPVEVIECPISVLRDWTIVAVMWVEAVVHLAVEIVCAMEPRADPDKHTAAKPLRSIVPLRGAVVRRIVEISIGASRRYADIDGDPGRCRA